MRLRDERGELSWVELVVLLLALVIFLAFIVPGFDL